MTLDEPDPKGLIREAYNIEGITGSECRSIFLDWALSLPLDEGAHRYIPTLIDRYGTTHPEHPMTRVLKEGLGPARPRHRRRGRTPREKP
ncbi:MAG: hypothetical protein AAF982_01240 [Pseudomonadota bacterium]